VIRCLLNDSIYFGVFVLFFWRHGTHDTLRGNNILSVSCGMMGVLKAALGD
jgi:hypothetical protein